MTQNEVKISKEQVTVAWRSMQRENLNHKVAALMHQEAKET